MLAYSQFVDQHLPVRLFKTAVVACRGDRAMDLVICLNNRLGILPSDCSAKDREAIPDPGKIAVGPTHRSKMPNDGLEHVHRLIVIDDVNKLECRNPGPAVWRKLDEPFRGEPD